MKRNFGKTDRITFRKRINLILSVFVMLSTMGAMIQDSETLTREIASHFLFLEEEPAETGDPEINEADENISEETAEPETESVSDNESENNEELNETDEVPESEESEEITDSGEQEETPETADTLNSEEPEETEDTDIEAVSEEIPGETEEVSYPAVTFTNRSAYGDQPDVIVTAEVPEGALPEGTEMRVTAIEADQELINEVENRSEGSVKYIQALDIAFIYRNEEIEPLLPVRITMKSDLIKEATEDTDVNTELYHLKEEAGTEKIEYTPADSPETAEDEIAFESDSFSVYVFVGMEVITERYITAEGEAYIITAVYETNSGIPEDAVLDVQEILDASELYEEYVSKTETILGMENGSAGYIRLFDIRIVDKDDRSLKYQPEAGTSVDVRIELADAESGKDLSVVHFANREEDGEEIESSTENGENGISVEFQAGSFSVYSIVDAPEPVPYTQNGWNEADSLDRIGELGSGGFYVSWNKYYLTGGLVQNVSNNSDRDGLSATPQQYDSVPEDLAAKFCFIRQEGTDTFKIYTEGDGGTRKYVQMTGVNGNINRAGLTFVDYESEATAFTVEKNGNSNSFYISAKLSDREYWWNRNSNGSGAGAFVGYSGKTDKNTAKVILSYYHEAERDPYKLDGKTFGIAYHDETTTAAALTAEGVTVNNQSRLGGLDMLMREDVLTNNGILLVAENSDIQEWTFECYEEDRYYIRTTVDGTVKYLVISGNNVSLTDNRDNASVIKATPGTNANKGRWHFTADGYSLNLSGNTGGTFNAESGNGAHTWLNLVEKSTLTEEDFVNYSAQKISASDEVLSATEKDENGNIRKDSDGNVVYKPEKTRVVVYTRVWNDDAKKYEFYAIDHDGSLLRVYDSGDLINWVGNRVNSALWEFTEYTNTDGTPNWYYELENTAYTGTYLAPQSGGIITDHAVGINMEGRRSGLDYTSIVAWDDTSYAYSGLKVVRDSNGSLKVTACPLDEADDFYFAVIAPPVEEADPTTTVDTVDNTQYGVSIKMVDFNNPLLNDRDSVQNPFFGAHPYIPNSADSGLLSTNLTNGYPTTTAHTGNAGRSLSELFTGMTSANHLFIQSVHNESGYFEYDSTQNFAHLNENGNFTVYNQIGAVNADTGPTREHGQFMPYNDISAENGYSHDAQGNLLTNQYNVHGSELPDTDPRKGEPLYAIPKNEADYFFGMELSAVFTQTPDGVDDWGHDIIFEFTGDDDFWFYVDGELVLDLGGIHKALGGSVNFRTGEVVCNNSRTTLYEVFRNNYQARGMTEAEISAKLDSIFVEKQVDGKTVHVFKNYSSHEMKMFYMERGAGASNLKMRFNLASVKPGTAELSKKLSGVTSASNKLIQYPYQIWYQTAEYQENDDGSYKLDENGNRIIVQYSDAVRLKQPETNANLNGQVYVSYKGTKTLVPYRESLTIGGRTYNDVFLLKAGETAVINFPEDTYQYKIVECGVNTEVYSHVSINDNEIFGKPFNNTDGTDSGSDIQPVSTTTYENSSYSDFGIAYMTTEERPRVEYTNQVAPGVMRTLSIRKVVYDSEGRLEQIADVASRFTFRLYLGNEFSDGDDLPAANMYSYCIKDSDGKYCRWNSADQKFVSLPYTEYEGTGGLAEYLSGVSSAERSAIIFKTSMNGTIANVPAGYTVEVRDLTVGMKYKVEERDSEIPKGFTRRDSDGYVRTDLEPDYVYYTEDGVYGRHELTESSTVTAEAISDTIVSKTESPEVEIRNQRGWGLTAEKIWTDKDFMIHDPVYLAVYLKNANNTAGSLVDGSVRRLNTGKTEIYWFFPDLKVNDQTYRFDQFIVREVELAGTPVVDESTGTVTGYTGITPVADGESIRVSGRTISGTSRTETYTVSYLTGGSTGQNENIRTDTVTNSRPGIQIYKTSWDGTKYLSDAVFTLKDSNQTDVGAASYTSDGSGLVTTAYLSEGTFTLNEIKAPTGYAALDEAITMTVTTSEPESYDLTVTVGTTMYYIALSGPDGFYTADQATETDMARITVHNRNVQELKAVKVGVNGETRTLLNGVHFALYDQVKDSEGNLRPAYQSKDGYDDLVTDNDGVIPKIVMSSSDNTEGLKAGTYYLREKEAPSGYKKLSNDLCFTIGEDGTVKINTAGYTNWLTRTINESGAVSYRIEIENMPIGITVRKTDENRNLLPGAQFVLSVKNENNIFVEVSGYGLGENGLIDLTSTAEKTFTGLPNGIYKLTETHAPAGYIILTKDIYFSVSDGAVTLTDENGTEAEYSTVKLTDDNTTIAVENTPGASLPSTGGPGTGFIRLSGILLAGLAGVCLMIQKRRSITE